MSYFSEDMGKYVCLHVADENIYKPQFCFDIPLSAKST